MEIRGEWQTRRVWIGDQELTFDKSFQVRLHSPMGFNWGYGGSGPAQLALALLLEFTTHEHAERTYQRFKREVIARLPHSDFTMDSEVIFNFLTHE